MNNKLLLLVLCAAMTICVQKAKANNTHDIMVMADPHVMASQLTDQGSAFDAMMAGQRKMLDLSQVAFTALVDTALQHQPSLVLIPGDLTKDGELESHDAVLEQLTRLKDAGINVLLIPGNHDIGGKAYQYHGADKTAVETLSDENWESKYAMVYEQATAKDKASHSYVAEPLAGVSVIGIDASHDDGDGYLSDASLEWILQQADAARQKGNMIIAMCHWQLLEHVDDGGVMMDWGLLNDSELVRDSLMAHGVHLVLTGHMHVNSISTYRDTINMTGDSIVEISTGSPITYPCPYRWLSISPDRSMVAVQTTNLTSLAGHEDLYSYSEQWMREHTKVIMPSLSVQMFDKAANVLENTASEMLQGVPMGSMIISMLMKQMPQTDEEKRSIVDKYLTNTLIELYLLHSRGNEHSEAKADSLAQAMYDGVDALIHDLTDATLKNYASVQEKLINAVLDANKVSIQSLVEDRTHWASAYHSDQTDDLSPELLINHPQQGSRVEDVYIEHDGDVYDVLGRRITKGEMRKGGVYVVGKRLIINN